MWKQNRRRIPSLITGLVLIVALLAGAGLVASSLLGTPFTTSTVDHSPPTVIVDLRDLAEYHAAQGQFEVVIDQEDDVQWMPSVLAGERVQFVSVGTVNAVVDFSMLPTTAVVVSEDGKGVTVTLPRPRLQAPVIDHDQSHVMNRDRGLFNRIGGVFSDNPTSEADLYEAASDKMAAAAETNGLLERAEDNVTSMLNTLLRSLGFERVDIRFPAG